jgi:hypothetical protein
MVLYNLYDLYNKYLFKAHVVIDNLGQIRWIIHIWNESNKKVIFDIFYESGFILQLFTRNSRFKIICFLKDKSLRTIDCDYMRIVYFVS